MLEQTQLAVDVVAEHQAFDGPSGVVVIATAPGVDRSPRVADADVERLAEWGVDLPRRLERARATGASGDLVWIDLERDDPIAVLALGLGAATPGDLRRAGAAACRRLRGQSDVLVLATADLDHEGLRAFVEGMVLTTGSVTWSRTAPAEPPARVRVVVADPEPAARAVGAAHRDAGATLAARRWVHAPPNLLSPVDLAAIAGVVGRECGLAIRVRGVEELAAEGFGGLLAVGAGSSRPPSLVVLDHDPGNATRRVVVVGKGITFDSGGLSLKKPDMQMTMKTDMSGAAVVLAMMAAVADAAPPGLRVTGVLCLAENLPGARATRPGDVLTQHGGLTTEVVNTDAEGRLVLADGLDHAVRDLAADVVVDVATLTGAATLALGRRHAALFASTDTLAAALQHAGQDAGEKMWRMPLHADYADLIASDVADQANAHTVAGPGPGAITAALFLSRFVGDTPWAHLDIAGPGRSEAERDDLPKGGTGFGARALLRWIAAGAPA